MFESLDYRTIEDKILRFITDFAQDKPVIVGLSGGIDSSIVCALAAKALGHESVKALIVENSRYSKEGLEIARNYAQRIGIDSQEINAERMTKAAIWELGTVEDIISRSTLDARICDLIIRTVARQEDRVYLGTINGTERLTGWYPKGSLVGDCCPIGGLLKEQEKHLAKNMNLGSLLESLPQDASKICSGCGELPKFKGLPYETLDTVLYIYETSEAGRLSANLRNYGIDPVISEAVLKRVELVAHKNDVFPTYCKINGQKTL